MQEVKKNISFEKGLPGSTEVLYVLFVNFFLANF